MFAVQSIRVATLTRMNAIQNDRAVVMNESQHTRYVGLDVLRGLAAMYVMLSHYTSYCLRTFGDVPFHIPRETGDYAVWLFFMISGFVIFFTIERSKTWVDFAVSRTTRLYPVYWITLTIVFVVEGLWSKTHGFWLGGYVANMTMLQEYFGYENHDIVYWSLTIEVAFYVIMAVLFRAGLTQRIGVVALAWLSMSWLAVWLARGLGLSMPTILTRYLIVQYIPFFLLGIMLYLNCTRGQSTQRRAIMAISLATVWLVHGTVDFVVATGLFFAAAFAVSERGKILAAPTLLWLGAISYSLYLIHRNLGYRAMTEMHQYGWPTWAMLVVTISGALALATALTYFVERPLCVYLRGAIARLRGKTT